MCPNNLQSRVRRAPPAPGKYGKGLGNVRRITEAFRAQGGNCATIEPHLRVFDGLKDLERAGETSAVGQFAYASSDAAFDAACAAFREML